MSSNLIKYAFTAGELSPNLFGRSDLEQYDLGLALAQNWIVDYRGGLSSRPGSEFCEFVLRDDLETRFFRFQFAPNIANVYGLLFGHNYIRFFQDGGYVLEAGKTVTALAGNVVTSNAHGFLVGDWVKLYSLSGTHNAEGRTFQISAVTTNTFTILVVPSLAPFVPQGTFTAGQVARIYTLASPYASTDLADLFCRQRRDVLRLTHPNFPIKNLIRGGITNWQLVNENIGNGVSTPVTGVTITPSAAGTAGVLVAVTAILPDGTESTMSNPVYTTTSVNYTVTAGSITINWNVHPQAVRYNIYRSIVVADGSKINTGYQLGYIGQVYGTSFQDNNIIPDFKKAPPKANNPFAPGHIEDIFVTAGGTGYTSASTVTVTGGGGSGFRGVPVLNSAGAVTGVRVIDRGINYASPVVGFTGGSGATAVANAAGMTDVFPSISAVFQQRQLYAATLGEPLTIWGSHPGKFSNFDYSDTTLDSDAYEFEIDSAEVSPLQHMIPVRGGLVVMSQTGVWLFSSGTSAAVTPTNANADPQTFNGVAKVEPLQIGTDLLYVEGKGFSVRLLSYNDLSKAYGGEDKSIISNHLFQYEKQVKTWDYAENPYKVVHAVRTDGAMLNFTVVQEEKVYAWTWSQTKGLYQDNLVLEENGIDRVYTMVSRFINGRATKFLERFAPRDFAFSEDSFCVDCGLSLGSEWPAAYLDADGTDGQNVTFTATAAVFAPGDVGSVLRMGGGKAYIHTYVSSTQIRGNVVREIASVIPQDPMNRVMTQPPGAWTLDKPVSAVTGLWHLEGETVSILADGNVIDPALVINGSITFPESVTRANIGLPYTCVAQTLSPVVSDAVIETRRKRIVGVATRVSDTRGLKTGAQITNLYDAKERTNELYGEPIELFSGIRIQMIEPIWDENGQTYFVQEDPLPATILGIVLDMEVGDDTD